MWQLKLLIASSEFVLLFDKGANPPRVSVRVRKFRRRRNPEAY